MAAGTGMEMPLPSSPCPPPPLPALAGTQHLMPLVKSPQIAPEPSILSQAFATSLLRKAAPPKSQGMPTAVWADDSPVALLPTASAAPQSSLQWHSPCPCTLPNTSMRGHQPSAGKFS